MFHVGCAKIFREMNYNDQFYNKVVSFFILCQTTRYARILLSPVKGVHVSNGDSIFATFGFKIL